MKALEIKVGALVLFSLVLLLGFVAVLGGFSFQRSNSYYVDYDFSGNIHAGAAVKISGIRVGKVDEVQFLGGAYDDKVKRRVQVRLTLSIEGRAHDAIHDDAEFFVNTQGVLGEQYLEIAPGSYSHPVLATGSTVRGVDPPRTDLIIARLYEFLDSVTRLLRDDKDVIRDFLRSGAKVVRTLDQLLSENQAEVKGLLTHLDQLTGEAAQLLGKVDRGVGDAEQLRRTLANIEAISATIKVQLDPLIGKTKRALDGVSDATAVLGPDERRKLMQALDQMVSVGGKVQLLTSDAQALVEGVRKGKGTAGALLVDPQVYDDVRELVRDLKRNPWKFFWKE